MHIAEAILDTLKEGLWALKKMKPREGSVREIEEWEAVTNEIELIIKRFEQNVVNRYYRHGDPT